MLKRFKRYAGLLFATTVGIYVALVVTTVLLASWQTELLSSISDTDANIGTLESQYYTAVASISTMDAGTLGFVTPTHKVYAEAASGPVLTRAD